MRRPPRNAWSSLSIWAALLVALAVALPAAPVAIPARTWALAVSLRQPSTYAMNAATEDSELGMEDSGSAIDPSVPSDDEDDCEFDMGASYKPMYAANSLQAGYNTRGAARQLRQQQQTPASPVTPPLRPTSLGPQQRQRQQQEQQQPSPPERLDLGSVPNSYDTGHNTRSLGGQQRQQQGTPELPVTDRLPMTSREAQQQQQQKKQQPSPPDSSPANPAVCVATLAAAHDVATSAATRLEKRRKTASGAALGVGGSVEAGNYDSES
ncbi:unnamed protein product [Ectocarpus sp. CCAP 1310/34]|nr:unnamed protein product [Ectocarpus sp. CCAP 1310/34]